MKKKILLISLLSMSILSFAQKEQNISSNLPDSLMQLYNISEDSVMNIIYRNLDNSSNESLRIFHEMYTVKNRNQQSEFNDKILFYIERKLNILK